MVEHYIMIVKKDDIKRVVGFLKRNNIIDIDGLDAMVNAFGDDLNINNFNLVIIFFHRYFYI